jgi:hypothetical protein
MNDMELTTMGVHSGKQAIVSLPQTEDIPWAWQTISIPADASGGSLTFSWKNEDPDVEDGLVAFDGLMQPDDIRAALQQFREGRSNPTTQQETRTTDTLVAFFSTTVDEEEFEVYVSSPEYANSDEEWHQVELTLSDLEEIRGKDVDINFVVFQDDTAPHATFYIDDVELDFTIATPTPVVGTPTATPGPSMCEDGYLKNCGFETNDSWYVSDMEATTMGVHSGNRALSSMPGTSGMALQPVAIPANVSGGALTFYWKNENPDTGDATASQQSERQPLTTGADNEQMIQALRQLISGDTAPRNGILQETSNEPDKLVVFISDPEITTIYGASTSYYDSSTAWHAAELGLASLLEDIRGKEVNIIFLVAQNDQEPHATFLIDDVELLLTTAEPTATPAADELPITLSVEAGYDTIQLEWTPGNDPQVTAYQVTRGRPGDQGEPITTTSKTFYVDKDPALLRGSDYCYQVAAMYADKTVVATSDTVCATLGQVLLSVPDIWARPGDQVIVPVNINNAHAMQLVAADIWLDFDSSVLEFVEIKNTPMIANVTWDWYISTPALSADTGLLKISLFSSPPRTLYGDGSLFWLVFNVTQTADDPLTLDLIEQQPGSGGSNITVQDSATDATSSLSLLIHDGLLYASNNGPAGLGDVNGDGVIQAIDSYEALQIASGAMTATDQQRQAADANGNGEVDAGDVTLILYRATHGEWPTPTEDDASGADPITISIQDVSGTPGTTIETTIQATSLRNWAGGDVWITYDPDRVEIVAYDNGQYAALTNATSANNFQIASSNDTSKGVLRFALASYQSLDGDQEIASFQLRIKPGAGLASETDATSLTLSSVHLNDAQGQDLEQSRQMTVNAQSGQVKAEEEEDPPEENDDPGKVYLPLIQR